jgi:hypothetical protein
MAYTNPKSVTYTRTITTGSNTTWEIAPPLGATQARVSGISVSATTTWTNTTTGGLVTVGIPSNTAIMGSLNLGTTASGSAVGFNTQFNKNVNPLVPVVDLTGTSNPSAISTFTPAVEALGPVQITFTSPTGGSPAGAGIAEVTIDWF